MKLKLIFLALALILVTGSSTFAADTPATIAFANLAWTPVVDTWQMTGTSLANGTTDSSNTIISAPLEQKGDILTYTWSITFGDSTSATSGPMAGIHVLASSPTDAARGNSILVWQDKNRMCIYQTDNGTMPAKQRYDVNGFTAASGETHTYRLVVDVKANELTVYRDDQLVTKMAAYQPISLGDYVSVRTNRTLAKVNSFSFDAK